MSNNSFAPALNLVSYYECIQNIFFQEIILCFVYFTKKKKSLYTFNLDYELTIDYVNRRKESQNSEFVLNELT